MRKQLEQRLFDLSYDMDMLGQEDLMWESIHMMTDDELAEQIREYEEEGLTW